MAKATILLLLLAVLTPLVSSETSSPTFCKCTCFLNSTLIPLSSHHQVPPIPPPPPSTNPPPSSPAAGDTKTGDDKQSTITRRAASSSCTQCNRAFCLKQNLPICKDAEEKDVTTSCFQRDSRKDQVIVWGFILGTAGLLVWAGLRRLLEARLGPISGLADLLAGAPGTGGGGIQGRRASGPVARAASPSAMFRGSGTGLGIVGSSSTGVATRGAYSALEHDTGGFRS